MFVLVWKVFLDITFQASKEERTKELMELRNPLLVLLVLVFTQFDGLLQGSWAWGSAPWQDETPITYQRATPRIP